MKVSDDGCVITCKTLLLDSAHHLNYKIPMFSKLDPASIFRKGGGERRQATFLYISTRVKQEMLKTNSTSLRIPLHGGFSASLRKFLLLLHYESSAHTESL